MNKTIRSISAVSLLVAAAPTLGAEIVGQWNMDQSGGIVSDSSGTAQDLKLLNNWSEVTGEVGRAIQFSSPNAIATTSGDAFNPGSLEFAITAVIKVNRIAAGSSANIVQHGLFKDPGQFKMQLNQNGRPECRIKGTNGAFLRTSSVNINDGRFHTVTCWRTATQIGITVDGTTNTWNDVPGHISAQRPLVAGNKNASAGVSDQFQGVIDCIIYSTGAGARALNEQNASC